MTSGKSFRFLILSYASFWMNLMLYTEYATSLLFLVKLLCDDPDFGVLINEYINVNLLGIHI